MLSKEQRLHTALLFEAPTRRSLAGSMYVHCSLYLKSRRIASADAMVPASSSPSFSLSLPVPHVFSSFQNKTNSWRKLFIQNPPPVLLVSSPCLLVLHHHLHHNHPFHPSLLIKMKANPLKKKKGPQKKTDHKTRPQKTDHKKTLWSPDTWEKPWDLMPGWVAESQPHQFEEKHEAAGSPAQWWTQAFCLRPRQPSHSSPRQSAARFLASWLHSRTLSW